MSSTVVKQGIVSVLGSECDQITKAVTLRRTLSADMSSKHWLAQNGYSFSPMKRIASSEGLSNIINESFSFSDHEVQKPSQDDIWGLIKDNEVEKSSLPPPYVHPLVRKSTSSLSEKSLGICTESLGSETGSDVFSSYVPIDTDENTTEPQEKEWQTFDIEEEPPIPNSSFSSTKIKYSLPKPFPPPLSSLAQRDGPTLHMQPHREDGRLVLEAVSVPTVACFHSHRQDGRLFLSFSSTSPADELDLEKAVNQEEIYDLDEEIFRSTLEVEKNGYLTETEEETDDDDGEENEIEEQIETRNGANELGIFIDQTPNYPSRLISVHRSALVIKKLRGLNNRDPKWTEKLKKQVNLVDTNVNPTSLLSQSLPRSSGMACLMLSSPVIGATASLNPYKYIWDTKRAIGTVDINPIAQEYSPLKNNNHNAFSPLAIQNQENALLRGNNGDYLVPLVRGCMENRKMSLLFREPYCIATS